MAKQRERKTKSVDINSFKPRNFKAKNQNQEEAIRSIIENQITFLVGSAGTGKTVCAVYSAVQALKNGRVDRIIVTRPVVEAGNERLGYLPGTFEEKIHPYLIPIYDELKAFVSKEDIFSWKTNGKLEIVPLALMRGRNFHNSFIILDEAQNANEQQLVMALTRFGMNSRMVITGDSTQSDLPHHLQGGFDYIAHKLEGLDDIGVVRFKNSDIIRNPLIGSILDRLK